MLSNKTAAISDILDVFDDLECVDIKFMFGRWKGFEISTGNDFDGMLVHSGWYGKMFCSAENVHPLLFYTKKKKALYSANPSRIDINLGIKLLKSSVVKSLVFLAKPFIKTKKSHARLRMIEFRNKVTATMVYDRVEIMDHFAKIDKNTVLGIMDMKGKELYVFVLERDDVTNYHHEF